jgi:3-methyladenine DNA glycosylase AlkC
MVEAFKNLLNRGLIEQAAMHLDRQAGGFDRERFLARALPGLDALEMKARTLQIADALELSLPPRFADAATLIEATLAPPREVLAEQRSGDEGLAGWILWPVGEFVARRGLDEPERGLQALHALTQRFTAEWAIRPFIVRHPALVYTTLQQWARDPSAHVRRLVSEGSRPRLPWGLQLKALIKDPSPSWPLLLALQDDPSEYVRRSVANHLNDIAKDHPAAVADWLEQHLPAASVERQALLRHASRSLIKAGDRRVLAAWGLAKPFKGQATLGLSRQIVRVGQTFELVLNLVSSSRSSQKLAVDYVLHHVKADGRRTPKVFKGWVLELPAGDTRQLVKTHSMREITTRRYHPGRHAVDIQINGQVVAQAEFDLRAATGS